MTERVNVDVSVKDPWELWQEIETLIPEAQMRLLRDHYQKGNEEPLTYYEVAIIDLDHLGELVRTTSPSLREAIVEAYEKVKEAHARCRNRNAKKEE